MDQFDLFDAPAPVAKPYQPVKAFAFPSDEWERLGHAPLFRVVCDRQGSTHNGIFWPRRRTVFGFSAHISTRRSYSALAA